eukprot:TRINITY_DN9828_c0_g1_i2.p1 TRINITY_DN9828_c0_g1~~TRINITY_DN9828_c0_g1_i2.p1  ORF type:complete len:206 (+),score=19.89 TRINITY_DN9828_c0_g1_i2:218-835(+)
MVSVYADNMTRYMYFLMAVAEALAIYYFAEVLLYKFGAASTLQHQSLSAFIRISTLQFAILKPSLEIFILVLENLEFYQYTWICRLLEGVTCALSFGALFLIFHRIQHAITDFGLAKKFIAFQICAFTPIIQSFFFDFISHLGLMTPHDTTKMDNALLIIWMLPISILLFSAFTLSDLEERYEDSPEDKQMSQEELPLLTSWTLI